MSAIRKGDLVMVSKPSACCGSTEFLGRVFVVSVIDIPYEGMCGYCGIIDSETTARAADGLPFRISRLTKIDPPALPESVNQHEELTA